MDKVGFVGWSLSIIMIFVSIKLGEHNSFFNKLIDIFVITMWVFWGVMIFGMIAPKKKKKIGKSIEGGDH